MKDSQEEIMELKAGIEISKGISHLAILFFKKYLEVLTRREFDKSPSYTEFSWAPSKTTKTTVSRFE